MLISALGTFTTLLVELLLLFLVISYAVALINRRFGPERLQSWMAGGAVPGQVKGLALGGDHSVLFLFDDPDVCQHAQSRGGLSHRRDLPVRFAAAQPGSRRWNMADLWLAGRAQLRCDHGAAVAGSTWGLGRAGRGRRGAQGQGPGRAPDGRDRVAWNQTRNPGSDPSGMGRSSPHAPSDDHRRDHRCIHLRGRARRPPGIYGRWKRLVADSTGCGDRYPAVCPTGDDAA